MILKLLVGLLCCTLARGWHGESEAKYAMSSIEEDGKLNMTGLTAKYGYPMETHTVTTRDGYILTLYRIPYGRMCGPGEGGKVPVLVQHGLLSSSYDFLILGPRKGLGYILADNCYDVWLGNNRGNGESKRHVSLQPSEKQFWTFSWHEMGQYDIPAMIDHILQVTGQPGLHYIGHSQGTTQFFVFGALRPEYHHKVRSMHALSPVAYMSNLSSPPVRFLTYFKDLIQRAAEKIGLHEIFPSQTFLNDLGSKICQNKYPRLQSVCSNVLFLLCGFDEPQLNATMLPAIIGHTPAGAGVKQLIHYAQGIKSEEFKHFDYGAKMNLKIYKSKTPPPYQVNKIKIPIALYYGSNDFLAALSDISKLDRQLPNVIERNLIPYRTFSHLDFLFAIDVKFLVYDRVLELLKKF